LICAVGLLAGSALAVGPIAEQRRRADLVLPPLPHTVRPSMLLTPLLALGRAPLVDYLWLRATKLKEEGRYFDAYQLAQMICELQPKFASVWAFQGWNMAYNISVSLKSPEERWRWIRNGFELIRDKGIPLNPHSTQLYRELAWILFHKVGDFMDEWQGYYKLQFAMMMEDILGPPPPGFVGPGRVAGDFYRDYDYKSLAEAPQRYEDLLKQPGVGDFVARLNTWGFDVSKNGVYLGLLSALREGNLKLPNIRPGLEETRLVEFKAFFNDPQTAQARAALERFWRAWRLRNEVKIDPARMLKIQEDFGVTLDLRLAETHALYWANLGLEMSSEPRSQFDIHRLNTNRIEFYCLQKMFHRGRLAMSPQAKTGEPPLLEPDIRMVKPLFEAFVRDSKEYLKTEHQKSPISTNFQSAFVGFTRTAILRYHELGMNTEAKELFDYLKKHFPDPMYDKGLDGFLVEQYRQDRDLNDYRIALARVRALIQRGLGCLAVDDDEQAARLMKRAREVYDDYQKGVASRRLRFPASFTQIVENMAHEGARSMYRQTYVGLCGKLGIKPLEARPATTGPVS